MDLLHENADFCMDSWDPAISHNVKRLRPHEIAYYTKNEWRSGSPAAGAAVKIHSNLGVGRFLLTCRTIRSEAQPCLAGSIHLVILNSETEIRQIPKACQQVYLPAIQFLTLSSAYGLRRHGHRFDVRQMPSLKLLTIIEPFEGLNRYEVVHKDVNRLVDFVHGDKDEVFIEDWFRKERQITRWAKDFADNLDHDMRQVMKEKNRACYWLRELMFHPEDRKFCVHYRRQLTLVMQTLGQATDKNPSLARYSNMKGNVRTQRRVLLDLDFDIDTRRVVSRHIQGRGGVDLSATADLKCWILSQFPEEIKELACNLNGGYSASNDSDIEDLIAEFGDEEDLVWRDVRYGAEGRGRTHEFGFFRRNLGVSEGDSEDDDYWGEDDYPDFSGVSDDGHHY